VAIRDLLELEEGIGPVRRQDLVDFIDETGVGLPDLVEKCGGEYNIANNLKTFFKSCSDFRKSVAELSDDSALGDVSPVIEAALAGKYEQGDVDDWIFAVRDLPEETTVSELREYLSISEEQARRRFIAVLRDKYELDNDGIESTERVKILTIHGSKGLSSSVVFVPGLEQRILPGQHRQNVGRLLREGARLLYVALTRSRVGCFVTRAEKRTFYGEYGDSAASEYVASLGVQFKIPNAKDLEAAADEVAWAYGMIPK
jgi:superfamily I DNA/RNA helicase